MTADNISRSSNPDARSHLFPVFLKLKNRICIIIGGGRVARRKAERLLECGAHIVVISPRAEEQIIQWAAEGLLTWHKKKFTEADLDGAFMAFAATNSSAGNKRALEACHKKGVLVNAADAPLLCDFFIPSVIRKKSLAVAISTEGKSPLFARKLREELEQVLTEEHGEFLEMLGRARETIQQTIPDASRRKIILKSLVYSDMLSLLKAGKRKEAQKRIQQCILSLQD